MRNDVERRLDALEQASGVDDEEIIINVVIVSPANHPPPDPGQFPPVEQQISEARARGEKRFIVFSNERRIAV